MSGPVYPFRDRRFDHEEWPSLERSELRAANHHVLYGGAVVVSAYPFVITGEVLDDLYGDFDTSDLRDRYAKRKAENEWPGGPMYGRVRWAEESPESRNLTRRMRNAVERWRL